MGAFHLTGIASIASIASVAVHGKRVAGWRFGNVMFVVFYREYFLPMETLSYGDVTIVIDGLRSVRMAIEREWGGVNTRRKPGPSIMKVLRLQSKV